MPASGYPIGRDQRGRAHAAVQPCRSCKAPMLWVVLPSGKRNPLDLEPTLKGNVLVLPGPEDWRLGVVVHDQDLLQEVRTLFADRLHTSHFATCPDADEHRRPRERADLA